MPTLAMGMPETLITRISGLKKAPQSLSQKGRFFQGGGEGVEGLSIEEDESDQLAIASPDSDEHTNNQ